MKNSQGIDDMEVATFSFIDLRSKANKVNKEKLQNF